MCRVSLGDASYSTYLLHPWSNGWTRNIAARVYPRLHLTFDHPAAFLAVALVAANLLGLLIHLLVERPLTRTLRSLNFGPLKFLNARPT